MICKGFYKIKVDKHYLDVKLFDPVNSKLS